MQTKLTAESWTDKESIPWVRCASGNVFYKCAFRRGWFPHSLPVVSQDVVFNIVRGWENKSLPDRIQSGDSAPAAASRAAAVAGSFPPPGLIQHLYLQPEPETKQFEVNDA